MEQTGQYGHWLPPDISTHGSSIDLLINVLHVFMIVLFVGWGIFMVYCLIRFRERPGHKAFRVDGHFKLPTYLEVGVAIFEVVLLIGISFPVWDKYKNDPPPRDQALVVRVVAEQFNWNIHYPGKDGKFGRTDVSLIDPAENPVGVDRDDDPNAVDDVVTINELRIPVNKPVIVEISSKDVIHSFSIPVLRTKQDAVPGMKVPVWFTATKTGEFDIACAQLCGVTHTAMRGRLFVESPEQFQQWMEEQHAEMMEYYGDEEA